MILHSLSAKRTSWNEFSSAMASALICLSSGQRFNFSKYIFESLVRNVDSTSKFYMYPRVGKGFSGVETPLFENMLAVRAIDIEEEVQVLDKCSELVLRVKGLETANAAQQLEIVKLKARVKKLERLNKVKSSKFRCLKKVGTSQRIEFSDEVENVFNQGRMSVDMETDKGVELVVDQEKDVEEDTEVQEAVEAVTTAKLITEVVTAAATQVVAASAPIPASKPVAKPKTLKIAAAPAVSTRKRKGVIIRDLEEELHIDTPAETLAVKDKGKGILIEDPKPMKKKDQVELDAEYAKKLQEELNKEHEEAYKQINWNAAFDHVQAKETQYIKRYHRFKKKPQSKSEARKNMISYLKNTEGYKMEFFKGKTYD
uniref:Synaptobrevin, longin-like domain protein n=1 Tax=Tanacetum cinerariifolium TaxID=118510 RepID=A0A699JBG8_TANCI|nr:synaptobrevin, longin-like domain protein [Tanacetum cinerariifolium]